MLEAQTRPTHEPGRSDAVTMGWPLVLAIGAYPVWWLIGLELVVWPVVAGLLVLELIRRPQPLRAPRGVMLWVAFLMWTVASAVLLSGADRAAAWLYRTSHYAAVLVIVIFVASVSARALPTRRLAMALLSLYAAIVIGGYLGIVFTDIPFPSVLSLVLPGSIKGIGLVAESVNLEFGNTADFLGVRRPSTLFAYTNAWAAALGVTTPLALFAYRFLSTTRARAAFWLLLGSSIVPVIVSVNRGLWVSLIVTGAAGLVLLAARGHLVAAVRILLAAITAVMVVWVTPLGDFVRRRLFETPNLSTRESLLDASLALTAKSPLVGWGAPVRDELVQDSNSLSVGTHGQLWTLLVSHGAIATACYFAFFLAALIATRRVGHDGMWLQVAVIVMLIQSPFYSSVPMPLVLGGVAVGLLTRMASRPQGRGVVQPYA